MHTSTIPRNINALIKRPTIVDGKLLEGLESVGGGSDALGGGDGLGLGGGVSCVGRFGGRGGGAGREDEPPVSSLSYSALLAGSLRISPASVSRWGVASAVGLGFRSG